MKLLCIYIFILWIFEVVKTKNLIRPITFIAWGVYFPLFLYLLNWSSLIDTTYNFTFCYIFIVLAIFTTIFSIATIKYKPNYLNAGDKIVLTGFGRKVVALANIIFIACYLLENYIGSGSFVPALKHIDIHAYSAPLISYITNAMFLFVTINFFAFCATNKKRYILYIIIDISVPVVTRSSRMMALICLVQLIVLILFFYKRNSSSQKYKKQYRKILFFIVVLFAVILVALVLYTTYRMNHYGYYDLDYSETIGFTGPDWLKWLSPYYGYFPLSFNNLKINLINTKVNHNYIGIFSFQNLYFGVLQLDNLFGINPNAAEFGHLATSSSATVPTAYWNFYYDFGLLLFIPIAIAFIFNYYLVVKASKEKRTIVFRSLNIWFTVFWFFTSFQNVQFMSIGIVFYIIYYFFIKRSFFIKNTALPILSLKNNQNNEVLKGVKIKRAQKIV